MMFYIAYDATLISLSGLVGFRHDMCLMCQESSGHFQLIALLFKVTKCGQLESCCNIDQMANQQLKLTYNPTICHLVCGVLIFLILFPPDCLQ